MPLSTKSFQQPKLDIEEEQTDQTEDPSDTTVVGSAHGTLTLGTEEDDD